MIHRTPDTSWQHALEYTVVDGGGGGVRIYRGFFAPSKHWSASNPAVSLPQERCSLQPHRQELLGWIFSKSVSVFRLAQWLHCAA